MRSLIVDGKGMNINRRNAIIGVATLPLMPQLIAEAKLNPEAEGFVVFYVHVGSLSPTRAEAFMERFKDLFQRPNDGVKRPDNWTLFFLPTREYHTCVELYKIKDGSIDQISEFIEHNICGNLTEQIATLHHKCTQRDDHIALLEGKLEANNINVPKWVIPRLV